MHHQHREYSQHELSRIIEMAWEDRTPFEAIESLYGLKQDGVIRIMRSELKPSSFRLWRKRTHGRASKHVKLRSPSIDRGYCPTQYKQR
ncbi:TIGR03643 family protein [Aestuariibacter sp. GS-14]|uniref:TIGR03643 family protein n=1 Tax=Aestuariibacter sp. GS-14 TaxID=2590670 RepID=UPI0021041D9B|nr:TIGR03643 family protein [Aestuariibacter sp. GS-14]